MQLNYNPNFALIPVDSEFQTITIGRHRIHTLQTQDKFDPRHTGDYLVDVYSGSARRADKPVLTIRVTSVRYTDMVSPDGSYTWTFYPDTCEGLSHPVQVSVGLHDITTSTLMINPRMSLTFKPTYRGISDEEATAIMQKIFDSVKLHGVPSVEYARSGEFYCDLGEVEEEYLQRLEALVLKIQVDASLRDELDIRYLEVEYI